MTRVDWDRAEPLLERLLELPQEEHEGFLARQCGEDERLAHDLLELVARGRESQLLEPPDALLGGTRIGEHIGPYRLIEPLGRGGMGEVWLAERADGAFDKRVAIKLIQRGLATDDLMRRFETERQVLAWLEHPGIARLIDGGVRADGRPYLAMDYVEGVPIDRFCAEGELTIGQRIELFLAVGEAVQHAHERGVVHRDLKPGNVLVDAAGNPKLLDFGIAKVLGVEDERETLELTRTGQRLFSPLYASPEQVRGEAVTAATDVYSLGMLLCELLTGRRPYDARTTSQLELERVVCETRPARPSDLAETKAARRTLRGDLDWIVGTALRKEPERRYASVRAMCDDLRRHAAGERVLARPDSLVYRTRTYTKRNRALVAGAAALFIGLAASLVLWRVSVGTAHESDWVAYAAALHAAEAAICGGRIEAAEGHLDSTPPELRGWEWRHLRSRLDHSERWLPDVSAQLGVQGLSISPDGELLAVRESHAVSLWSCASGELVRSRVLSSGRNIFRTSVSYHPSGDLLAVVCGESGVHVLHADSLETATVLEVAGGHVCCAIYDPRGRWLACGLGSGEIVIIEHASGREVARWVAHEEGAVHLSFDRSGDRLLSASWDKMARVWSVPAFELEREFGGHTRCVTAAAFAAGGELVVTSSLDGTARVWYASADLPAQIFRGHGSAVDGVVVAADGETVFSGGEDGTILRWNLRSLEILGVLRGHRFNVTSMVLDTEGRLLSGDMRDPALLRWRPGTDDVTVLKGCLYQRSIALNPGRDELAISEPGGLVRRWSLASLAPLEPIPVSGSPVIAVAYSLTGDRLFACSHDGWVRSWSLPDRQLETQQWVGSGEFEMAAFDGTGEWAVTVSRGEVGWDYRRIDMLERTSPALLLHVNHGRSLASAGTEVFATDESLGLVWRVDTSSWERRLELETEAITEVAADSSGRRVLVGHPCAASLWIAGERQWLSEGIGGTVVSAAFHPTEPRVAVGTDRGELEILDARDGRRLVHLTGHVSTVEDLVYTPDGERLFSCSADGTVRVWDSR